MQDKTQEQWCELHKQSRFLPKYPSEAVVRFVFGHVLRPNTKYKPCILDLGCGGGRHTVFLAREGYQVVGSDFSPPALTETQKLLTGEGLEAELCLADAKDIPFADCAFDAVVAYASLYYMKWADMAQSVKEIHRLLKPGGNCFVHTRADSDYRCGKGLQLDEKSYLLNTEETNESGMVNCFVGKEDIPVLFADFSDIIFEKYEFTAGNREIVNSDWGITATKGV